MVAPNCRHLKTGSAYYAPAPPCQEGSDGLTEANPEFRHAQGFGLRDVYCGVPCLRVARGWSHCEVKLTDANDALHDLPNRRSVQAIV